MELLITAKAIVAKATALNKRAETYSAELHVVLCSAMQHALVNGDTRIVDQVFDKVHKSTSKSSIDAWIRGYSNLRRKTVNGTEVYKKAEKKPMTWMAQEAMDNPFWSAEFSKDNKARLFDFDAQVVSLFGRAHKAIKDDVLKTDNKDAVIRKIAELETLARNLKIDLSKVDAEDKSDMVQAA